MLVCAAFAWLGLAVQGDREIEKVPIAAIPSVDGAALYAAYCADCHGGAGRGDGRASEFLAYTPADLTQIGIRYGTFDRLAVENRIAGASAWGGSYMPHWEVLIAQTYRDHARELVVVDNLVRHLETLQQPYEERIAAEPPAGGIRLVPIRQLAKVDGETVYAAYCAGCHGVTGVGNAEVAKRLGREIPDLTRLPGDERQIRLQVAEALRGAHMLPGAGDATWQQRLVAVYGNSSRRTLLTYNVGAHVASLSAER